MLRVIARQGGMYPHVISKKRVHKTNERKDKACFDFLQRVRKLAAPLGEGTNKRAVLRADE